MAKNKMKQVAELLGVELGEEFRITEYGDNRYRLTEYGIEVFGDTKVWTTPSYLGILNELIVGCIEIKKFQSWMPKKNETYYYPYFSNGDGVNNNICLFDSFDIQVIDKGMACKTKEEAKELHDWIVEQVKKYRGVE